MVGRNAECEFVSPRECVCGWPQRCPFFNKSIVCVSPDWEHIGPGSGSDGDGVQGLGADRGSCSLGVSPLVLPLLSSEVPAARGATKGRRGRP